MKKVYLGMLLAATLFAGCSKEEEKAVVTYSDMLNRMKTATGLIEKVYDEQVVQLREGVDLTHINFECLGERTHMFVAQIDLNKVTIVTSTPNDEPELANPDAIMPVHAGAAEGNGKKVWLGINGDYWAESSLAPGGLIPMSYFFKDGVGIVTTYYEGHTEVIYKKKDGSVGIGTVNDVFPQIGEMQEVCGGRGKLVINGELIETIDEGIMPGIRNPRTTVGITADKKTLYFLIVDGRRVGYSAGLDLYSTAKLLKALGCSDAIALDGGGSTTLVMRKIKPDGLVTFPVINKPSDSEGVRTISNGILVIEKEE